VNRELVGAEWTKATGALRSAKILTRAGEYNDAVTRAYYAMRHASLAALAARGTTPPRTHQGLQNAVRNQLVHGQELRAERLEQLGEGRQNREDADYDAFSSMSREEAEAACKDAGEFLAETRRHLLKRGIESERVPDNTETPAHTPVRPGGDPGIEAPPARPVSQPRGPAGNNPDRER